MSSYNPTWQTPKTDRTEADTTYAAYLNNKGDYDYLNDYMAYLGEDPVGDDVPLANNDEITDWDAGLPGAMTQDDFNRVNGNIWVVGKALRLGVTVYTKAPLTPANKHFDVVQEGVQKIYNAYHRTTTPPVPEQPYNTWQKWNDIEQIIADAYDYAQNRFFPKCGTDTYCGEGGLLL